MRDFFEVIAYYLQPTEWFFLGYFILVNATYIILVVFSLIYIRKRQNYYRVFNLKGIFNSALYKPVSILSPAFNEEKTIINSVESLLQLHFSNYEVIVINDGSKDNTMALLKEHFDLYPIDIPSEMPLKHARIRNVYKSPRFDNLKVVDKENGRKADALNAGINISSKELICSIDADSILEPDVLTKLLKAFVEEEGVIAVGGIIRIANGCTIENNLIKKVDLPRSYLGRIQTVEYLRSFLFGRVGWDYFNSLLIISGAFGVFSRKAVMEVGGYLHETVGEDMELVVRMHRHYREKGIPYKVRFMPEPVCWTEVPENWGVLGKQRNRWQRGLADTLMRHRVMFMNPRYGPLGIFAVPYFVVVEMLGPLIEIFGFLYFLLIMFLYGFNSTFVLLFITVTVFLGMVLSITSVFCEELSFRRYPTIGNVATMTLYAFLENIGYRQIHSWWRLRGLFDYVKGNKQWGVMVRKGFGPARTGKMGFSEIKNAFFSALGALPYWIVIYATGSIVLLLILNALAEQGIIPDLMSLAKQLRETFTHLFSTYF